MHPACTLTLHSANTWLPNPLCFLYVCSNKDLIDANIPGQDQVSVRCGSMSSRHRTFSTFFSLQSKDFPASMFMGQ